MPVQLKIRVTQTSIYRKYVVVTLNDSFLSALLKNHNAIKMHRKRYFAMYRNVIESFVLPCNPCLFNTKRAVTPSGVKPEQRGML